MAIAAVALPVAQRTPEWLEARRLAIGGSDAPVVAGESPYKSPVQLWSEKLGLVEPEPENAAMAWGRRLEPVVAAAYTEATGRRVRRVSRLLRSRERPWQVASIDREVVGERRLVEIKCSRSPRWDGEEPVPGDVLAQCQHYLSVLGWDVADVAVLVAGSDLRVIEVPRDDDYIRDLLELEADFMHRLETRTPPELDGSESTRRTLARLHPADDGTELVGTPDTDRLLSDLRSARERAAGAGEAAAALENRVRGLMGSASVLTGDGYRVSYRRNADSLRVDWAAVAAELAPDPALVARFTTTRDGPRVLRITYGGTQA